jgi:CheY-like chemotaxis protein
MSHILIVDDIPDNILFLQTCLEAEGYKVTVTDRGMTALRLAKTLHPDIILLDAMMPDMTGYGVTEQIREDQSLSTIKIILVTAYTDISQNEAIAMGANAFIRKPIDLNQLLGILEGMNAERGTRKDEG